MGSILTRKLEFRLTPDRQIGGILAFGAVCRVAQYLSGREFWLDEGMLAANIVGQPILGGPSRSAMSQVFPMGFIVVERLAAQVLGDSTFALRLFPLLCGVGALFLFLFVAKHVLEPGAVPVALALFAVSDDLIYFSAELKQYSGDVLATLAAYAIAILARRLPATPGRVAGLAVLGGTLVWFSHPSVFVLAAVGTVLLGSALAARGRRATIAVAILGATWVLSFAGSHAIASRLATRAPGIWVFWATSFPSWPPASIEEALWAPRAVLNLFVNPLSFDSPIGRRAPALVAFVLFLIGAVSLGRRKPGWLFLLLAPIGIGLLVAYPKLYPFHGRLVLFLVPAPLLLVAEGVEAIGRKCGRRLLYGLVVAVLLFYPTLLDLGRLGEPRTRSFFNPVGDYREIDEGF